MHCVDVNILIHAYVASSPSHRACSDWLTGSIEQGLALALPQSVLSGFLRIVTNRAFFPVPSSTADALAFGDWLIESPRVLIAPESPRAYRLAATLISEHGLAGNDVPDAFIAASALDLGATLVTTDRGFRRFRDLPLLDPTG